MTVTAASATIITIMTVTAASATIITIMTVTAAGAAGAARTASAAT
jgi:hypothetical protein